MVRKLRTRCDLDEADAAAILKLPHIERSHHASTYLVREGEPPRKHCIFLESGFAFRQKITLHGARQIVSLHLPGDFLDLQNLFLTISDHNVQALTEIRVIGIDRNDLQNLVLARPNVGKALWIDALVDSSIYREWVTNVGRRSARARVAHILCEFGLRLEAAGLASEAGFELPLTQDQLADALGLTPVHVNRTLKSLAADGVVHRDRRYISFSDWDLVRTIGDFNALYLHLDQVRPV
jgi:CRP-like cAMP-binding protein